MARNRSSSETPPRLASKLFEARSDDDVSAILSDAKAAGIASERFLGDRENNAGTVQLASNPYSAIIERVTNATDAMLELFAERNRAGDVPSTPREAARRWFGVPRTGINDLTTDERRVLAEHVKVVLDDSGIRTQPTIIVTDGGIGQRPMDFPSTLLSLNESNKLRKSWLQGAYGQGGSATLRFCRFTTMLARRAPDLLADGDADLVGWTIVWEDEGDPNEDALPMYKYLVGPDNDVPTFPPSLLADPSWHGVRIAHISYQLPRYSQAYTQLTTGAWGMFHAYLFDPVLPFVVGGRRGVDLEATGVKGSESTRVVVGNAARLNNPEGPSGDLEVTYSNTETFDLGKAVGEDLGRFRIHYWVLQRGADSSSKEDPTASYVGADSAVSMTLYGQRQDAERRAWLKNQVSLPYLQKNLIVQIDVDDLSRLAKRRLFSSTRERGVEGELRDTIYRETAALLQEDDELRRLDAEERERMRAKGAAQVAEKVREKLRKFVNTLEKDRRRPGSDGGDGKNPSPPPRPPRPPTPPRNTDDNHLSNVPSRIFIDRDPIVVAQGRRTTVWVDVDAKNGYLRRHEDDLSVSISGVAGKVSDVAQSDLLAGRSLWTLQAAGDAPLGSGSLEVLLVTPNGLLRAEAKIVVVKAPAPPKHRGTREERVAGPNIGWVRQEQWEDFDFTERTVGRVDISADSTDIWVNRDQRLLAAALRSRRLSATEVKTREDRYLFAVGCGLYRQQHQVRDLKEPPGEEYALAELERLAEAVLIAIDEKLIDFDDD